MKRKINILTILLTLALVMSLAGCGKEEKVEDTQMGSINEEAVDPEVTEELDIEDSKEDVEIPTEELENVITKVSEDEAFVNVDGVKVPMNITWDEFKQLMSDNNWTFVDSESSFPNGNKLDGNGYIKTNCGDVKFYFMESEDKSFSELRKVKFDPVYLTNDNINISGINIYTTYEDLDNKLQLESENEAGKSYYLDDYLTVTIVPITTDNTSAISVERTMYKKR